MIQLDYETPKPPEPGQVSVVVWYICGLALGLLIAAVVDRTGEVVICGGFYSILPLAVFWFVNFIRGLYRRPSLEERNKWITIFTGMMTIVVENEIWKWSMNTWYLDASTVALAAWFILPSISAFVSVRRRRPEP